MSADGAPTGMSHSWERERTLLGAILLDETILDDVSRLVTAENFHRPTHAATFRLLVEMAETGEPLDVTAVFEVAMARGIETYGGVQYLLNLPLAAPSVHAWHRAALDIQRHAFARDVQVCALRLTEALGSGVDPLAALAHHEAALLALRRPETTQDGMVHIAVTGDELLIDYGEREAEGVHHVGEPTGYADLDRLIGGLVRKDLIVVGGRPSMGKTAFAVNCALNIARTGGAVGMFSMEMSRSAVVRRVLATVGRVDFDRLMHVRLTTEERRRMVDAVANLRDLPVYIDERGQLSVAELRQRARRWVAATPSPRLLLVDYLQLAKGSRTRGQSREQEVSEVSQGLKVIARELDIPVVAVAQLNRSLESRPPKERRPMCSDLRDSGQIEQDADVILFLYRDEVYDPASADKGVAEVIVAKQRNGQLGTARLAWLGHEQRFANLERREPTPRRDRYPDEDR